MARSRDWVHVSGLRELDAALGDLPRTLAKGVLRRTAFKALEPMAEVAREHAPDDPSTSEHSLKDDIIISTRQKSARQIRYTKSAATLTAYMGPTRDHAEAIAQEFGAGPHIIKPRTRGGRLAFEGREGEVVEPAGVMHPGNPPHPFMRPAWYAKRSEALQIVKTELGRQIVGAAKRLARRRARQATKG